MENNAQKINWYPGHMAKTKRLIKENISLIDVVFELVDARIPVSSKIDDLDEVLRNKPKVLIMTKYDLCDKEVTENWISYYEDLDYNVVTVNLKNNFDYKKILFEVDKVREIIDEKRSSKDLKAKEINALVIGIPNVGKSTLINTLAGKKSQKVENKPGVTKELSWIKTNHNLKILDTPGMLWPKLEQVTAYKIAAISSIKEEIMPVEEIASYILSFLNEHYPNILKSRYGIKNVSDLNEIYEIIASKVGALTKDDIDYERVSKIVINDIKNEKITGITFDCYDG